MAEILPRDDVATVLEIDAEFKRDATDFLLKEGLPLLSAFRLIESRQIRQAIFEIVKRAAGVSSPHS